MLINHVTTYKSILKFNGKIKRNKTEGKLMVLYNIRSLKSIPLTEIINDFCHILSLRVPLNYVPVM